MAIIRLIGSFIGALVAGIFLLVFSPSVFLSIPIVFVAAIICKFTHFEEGLRLSALTAAIILAVSLMSPDISPFYNALARFLESFIGIFLAVIIRWLTLLILVFLNKFK